MSRRNLLASMLVLMVASTLWGCGKDQALENYKKEMTVFYDNYTAESEGIEAIEPTTETAVEDLLTKLDKIDAEFTAMAELEVPEQFSAVESLADEAAAYMTEAVALFHQAYENEESDESFIPLAGESYQRAIKRVQYIGDILMGKVPDDENVEVYYEDDTSYGKPDDTPVSSEEVPTEVSTDGTTAAPEGTDAAE